MPRSKSSSPGQSPRRRSRTPPPASKTCSLLVRQLVPPTQPFKVKQEEVKQYFEQYGPVKDVYLPVDYYTRRPRGFGFVEFESEKDARDALDRSDGQEVLGATLKVVMAREGRKAVIPTQPTDMKHREDYHHKRRSRSSDRRHRRPRR
jgi:RNA recognition motif-containing protein